MSTLPDDFYPYDRLQAQLLADERGCAWYYGKHRQVFLVESSTPLDSTGKFCFRASACQISAMQEIVRSLNQAYLMGLRKQTA